MKNELSDDELILALKNHDRAGAEALYDKYALTLYKIIYCSVHDCEIAERVLQKTILAIWENMGEYQLQDSRLLIWMAGIARRLAREAALVILPVTLFEDNAPLLPIIPTIALG